MANEFICSDCGKDGTRCDCHKKGKNYYSQSYEEKKEMMLIQNEIAINKLRLEIGLPPIINLRDKLDNPYKLFF